MKLLASVLAILTVLITSASVLLSVIFDGMVGEEVLQEMPYRDCTLRLYRGGGGATTSYWLVVREECEYFDAFQMREVHLSRYRAYEGVMSLSREGLLTLEIGPYGDLPAQSPSVELQN